MITHKVLSLPVSDYVHSSSLLHPLYIITNILEAESHTHTHIKKTLITTSTYSPRKSKEVGDREREKGWQREPSPTIHS